MLDEAAKRALEAYSWPGNIRELNHVMERAQILSHGDVIGAADLGLPVNNIGIAEPDVMQVNSNEATVLLSLAELELNLIDQRLSHFEGNVLKAAKSLGLSRSALYRRLDKT